MREGNESLLLECGKLRLCKLCSNKYVLKEIEKVLHKLGLNDEEIPETLTYLFRCVTIVEDPLYSEIKSAFEVLNDKKDAPVLAGALNFDYFVTGDKELLRHKEARAVNARIILEKLGLL
ncbi:MAG: PIN domain-containing protein [Candidatus Thermoplasmatota archaeon]|nr:PIN domain-containing protein [Candidatus Thermoplasmatota archaeon]